MARKDKYLRYIVTGPGIEDEPSYADPGPALSRALTAACRRDAPDGTWYARDSVTDEVIGYAEKDEKIVRCVRR